MFLNYPSLVESIYNQCQRSINNNDDWASVRNSINENIFDSNLKDAFDATLFDFGGHNKNMFSGKTLAQLNSTGESNFYNTVKKNVMRLLKRLTDSVHDKVVSGIAYDDIKDDILKAPIHFKLAPMLHFNSMYGGCSVCGRNNNYYMKDGVISLSPEINAQHPCWDLVHDGIQSLISVDDNSVVCPYPNGIDTVEQFMDITSDFIVIAGSFDDLIGYNVFAANDYINSKSELPMHPSSEAGTLYTQEYWLTQGVLRVHSGRLAASVIYNKDTGIIASVYADYWKNKAKYKFPINVDGFRSKGTLPDDFFTVQVVDGVKLEEYAKNCNMSFKEALLMYDAVAIKVKPGKYKITTYFKNSNTLFSIEPVKP